MGKKKKGITSAPKKDVPKGDVPKGDVPKGDVPKGGSKSINPELEARLALQETCKHSWIPAGQKKNRDRVHNKGNGKGKYMAYKCEDCGLFKRRFLK